MFDYRYHVASLAAVFLALAVGILLGVGISGRGLVDDAERNRLRGTIEQLRVNLQEADARATTAELLLSPTREFVRATYPTIANRRLAGMNIEVIAIGTGGSTLGWTRKAVRESGGNLVRLRVLEVPIRVDAIRRRLSRGSVGEAYDWDGRFDTLGRDLGHEFPSGGDEPLWDLLTADLLQEQDGTPKLLTDAVVIINETSSERGATRLFLSGLYTGLADTDAPVVGVELARVARSAIPLFQRHAISTVDGIDGELGRLAMILVLGGADPGDYGVRDTADDGLLPPIEPLPAPSG